MRRSGETRQGMRATEILVQARAGSTDATHISQILTAHLIERLEEVYEALEGIWEELATMNRTMERKR